MIKRMAGLKLLKKVLELEPVVLILAGLRVRTFGSRAGFVIVRVGPLGEKQILCQFVDREANSRWYEVIGRTVAYEIIFGDQPAYLDVKPKYRHRFSFAEVEDVIALTRPHIQAATAKTPALLQPEEGFEQLAQLVHANAEPVDQGGSRAQVR